MRRALVAAAVATVVLSGCSGTDEPTSGQSPAATTDAASPTAAASSSGSPGSSPDASESLDDSGEALEIEIEGDDIEPRGKRVKVAAGETVTFAARSDRATELHVHSSPEQVLEISQGESTLTLVVERPGIVDVEEHESGLTLYQLEVR